LDTSFAWMSRFLATSDGVRRAERCAPTGAKVEHRKLAKDVSYVDAYMEEFYSSLTRENAEIGEYHQRVLPHPRVGSDLHPRHLHFGFAHRPVRQAKSQPAEQEALAEDRL
jgi:hypothetical protein